jgi:cellulose synthase/poly-beta-1,6-N-acetylglucosamine synthase-like glycosyltransferase
MQILIDILYHLVDAFQRMLLLLFLDPINGLCLALLLLNTFGYVLFLGVLAKIVHRNNSWKSIKSKHLDYPLVSFIIPAHNEEETIEHKLKNTLALEYPKESLEIIVVDDGSTDNTSKVLEKIRGSWLPTLRVIRQDAEGKSSAENNGLRNAHGEIIVISDADVPLNPKALLFMLEDFRDPKVGGVTCAIQANEKYVMRLNLNLALRTRELENQIDSIFGMSGPFVSFRKSIISKIDKGIFSSDTDIGVIIRKKGFRVLYDPRIMSHVDTWVEGRPKTVLGALKKLRHLSFGSIVLLLRHKDVLFKVRYGLFGLVIAPRHLLLNVFAPVIFAVLTANFTIKLVEHNLFLTFLLFALVFLSFTFLSRNFAPNFPITRIFHLVFMYILFYYAEFFYYMLFFLRSSYRKGKWSDI